MDQLLNFESHLYEQFEEVYDIKVESIVFCNIDKEGVDLDRDFKDIKMDGDLLFRRCQEDLANTLLDRCGLGSGEINFLNIENPEKNLYLNNPEAYNRKIVGVFSEEDT